MTEILKVQIQLAMYGSNAHVATVHTQHSLLYVTLYAHMYAGI